MPWKLIAAFALAAFTTPIFCQETPKCIVLGHYRNDLAPIDLPYGMMTHVSHYGAWPGADGNPVLAPYDARPEFIAECHSHGVKALLLVSNPGRSGGGSFHDATRTARRLAAFADKIADLVAEHGYDGIDLDWEFPTGCLEIHAWNALLKALDKAMAERGSGHVVFASVPYWGYRIPKKAQLGKSIDYLDVMTYDFFGTTWGSAAGNQAPLRAERPDQGKASVMGVMEKWKHFPTNRILIGLPFYGYTCYGLAPFERIDHAKLSKSLWEYQSAPEGKAYIDDGVTWAYAMKRASEGWTRVFNPEVPSSWYFSPDGRAFVAIDDPAVIGAKTAWAKASGYAGVFIWYLGADRMPDGSYPLMEAVDSAR